jgi:hypothetical protein|nr:hypothetical protein [uncultured Cellulosilyticum sp.]
MKKVVYINYVESTTVNKGGEIIMFKATIDFFDEYKKYYILANSRAEAKSKLERYLKGIDFVCYELETVECDLIIN